MVLVTSRYRENLSKTDRTYKESLPKRTDWAESSVRRKVGW